MSTTVKIGLILAGLLGVADLATPFATDGEHPPMVVALIAAALGLATLAALVPAWRGSRAAAGIVAGTRLVSAVGALPAFFVSDAPAAAVAAAGIGVALTLLAVALLVPALRPARA
jgi:hypothetical protein